MGGCVCPHRHPKPRSGRSDDVGDAGQRSHSAGIERDTLGQQVGHGRFFHHCRRNRVPLRRPAPDSFAAGPSLQCGTNPHHTNCDWRVLATAPAESRRRQMHVSAAPGQMANLVRGEACPPSASNRFRLRSFEPGVSCELIP